MTARAGVERTTLQLKVIDSTKAPSRPTIMFRWGAIAAIMFRCNAIGVSTPGIRVPVVMLLFGPVETLLQRLFTSWGTALAEHAEG